jgi:O-antigen/teichoic acid export membrane protein
MKDAPGQVTAATEQSEHSGEDSVPPADKVDVADVDHGVTTTADLGDARSAESDASNVDRTDVDEGRADDDGVGATVGHMFRRDSLYMVASSLQLLAGVVVTPLMTRVLGLHQYGIFAADLALLYVLYYTSNLGLNIGIQRLFSQPDGERKSRNLLAASLVLVTAVTAVVYATGPLWSPHLGFGHFPLSTRLTVVWSGLFAMTWICLAILRCNEKLMVFATVCFMQAVVGIGIGTAVAYFGLHLATEVLWCAMVVQALAVVLSLITITPHWRGAFDIKTLTATLAFSLPIVPLQISTFVMSASDRFVILKDLGPGPTGRYQVAYTLGAVGISLLTFLNLAWLPRIFAIKDRTTRALVLSGSRDGLYRIIIPVTIGIALGGPIVLHIWAPRSFHTVTLIPVVTLVVASTLPVCTAFVHSRLMLSEDRSATVALVTLFAALANIALNLAMVPRLGINGSALATLITYFILAFGMAALSRRLLPLARPPLRLWGALVVSEVLILASKRLPIHGGGLAVRVVGLVICGVVAIATVRKLQLR